MRGRATLAVSLVLFVGIVLEERVGAQDLAQLKTGVVKITASAENKTKVGTGFIVRLEADLAYIVTAAHVVSGDPQPKVHFFSRQDVPVPAQVKHAEGGDEATGLALLVVRGKGNIPTGLAALPLAAAVRVSGGEDIMVIGHPRGAGDWAIIKGSIASRQGRDLIVDANIDEGNSGGPIMHNGQVVGLIGGALRYGKGVTVGTVREYLEGHNVFSQAQASWREGVTKGSAVYIGPKVPRSEPLGSLQTEQRKAALQGITGTDGSPMVLVPAGEFMMGSRADDKSTKDVEWRGHAVYLDAFYIDQYEVTTSRYATFFRETNRAAPKYWSEQILMRHGSKPVLGVDWNDAIAYCTWAGKRLPTEVEWEKAARGTDQRIYPWGNEAPNEQRANFGKTREYESAYERLTAVGSFEQGKSPYGAYDMAGNVWELVADWYDYSRKGPERNPTGPSSGQFRVIRGGAGRMNRWMYALSTGGGSHP